MTKGQTQVREFMKFFGQDCPEKPTQINEETVKLRAKLILEEALETIVKGLGLKIFITHNGAEWVTIDENSLKEIISGNNCDFVKFKEVDLNETVDGISDLAYVGEFGTAVSLGIDLEPIQDIIHKANMRKAWTKDQLDEAKYLYPTAKVEDYGEGLYRLIREDGKIIKSPNFVSPNEEIAKEIELQKNS